MQPHPTKRTMRAALRRVLIASFVPFAALLAASAVNAQTTPPVITCNMADTAIFNTGYNGRGGKLVAGALDSHWEVTDRQPRAPNVSAPPVGLVWHRANVGNLEPNSWSASTYPQAEWISRETGTSDDGDWYYRYQFQLDQSVSPGAFQLGMDFLADNSVAEIFVNGILQTGLTGVPQAGNLDGYTFLGYHAERASQTLLTRNWVAGLNTVIVRIQSDTPYEGFLASIRPTALCSAVPHVRVTKTASPAVVAGGTLRYIVTAENTGTLAANGTVVNDTLPTSLTGVSWTCVAAGGAACPRSSGTSSLAETLATFPAGGRVVYTIDATVPATTPAGQLTNTASVTPPTGGTCGECNATAITTVGEATPVPTLGTWALMLLGALMGGALLSKRRASQR